MDLCTTSESVTYASSIECRPNIEVHLGVVYTVRHAEPDCSIVEIAKACSDAQSLRN